MEDKARQVRAMFGTIAPNYDLANRVLSMGMDVYWRHCLAKQVQACQPKRVLDLASGTGDVAFTLRRYLEPQVEVIGLDFCPEMLEQARLRLERKRSRDAQTFQNMRFSVGDCLDLPIEADSVDAISFAFGLRNVADRAQSFKEIKRVLKKPHGRAFILEFTQANWLMRPFYSFYLKHWVPFLGGRLTGNTSAYDYLHASIQAFPDKQALAQEIEAAELTCFSAVGLTGSIVALHSIQA